LIQEQKQKAYIYLPNHKL